MNVVIGTGYVGLTTGVTLAFLGHQVAGLDVDAARIAGLNGGELQSELKILTGRTIALLGLVFKPNTDDLRDVPALDIARLLAERKAKIQAHDPVAIARARTEHSDLGICYCDTALDAIADTDALVLVTEWPQYRDLPWEAVAMHVRNPLVLEGRNFLNRSKLAALGFRYLGVG